MSLYLSNTEPLDQQTSLQMNIVTDSRLSNADTAVWIKGHCHPTYDVLIDGGLHPPALSKKSTTKN